MKVMERGPEWNISILCGEDKDTFWGNTCFFTYFSQFQRSSPNLPAIEAALLFLFAIIAVAANVSVLANITDTGGSGEGGGGGGGPRTLTVTNLYVCNMAAADLLFNVTAPLVAVTRLTVSWVLGPILCHSTVYTMFVCGTVTTWSLCLISIDRYTNIVGLPRRFPTKPRGAYVAIAIMWLSMLVTFLPLAHFFVIHKLNHGDSKVEICTLSWPRLESMRLSIVFLCLVSVIAFFIPLIIITLSYTLLFRTVWSARRQVAPLAPRRTSASYRRQQRDLRLVKTLVVLVLVFFLMWLPIFSIMALIVFDINLMGMRVSSTHLMAAYYLAQCNTGVNAFLYGLVLDRLKRRLANFKQWIMSRWTCIKRCSRRPEAQEREEEVPEMNGSISAISTNVRVLQPRSSIG